MKRSKRILTMSALLAGSCVFAQAAEPTQPSRPAQLTLPPNFTRTVESAPEEQPIQCDLRASPDFVADVDVEGREVAPADVPTSQEVELGTEVFVETRSRNPRLRDTGMIVNLPGLGAPACVPLDEKLRN